MQMIALFNAECQRTYFAPMLKCTYNMNEGLERKPNFKLFAVLFVLFILLAVGSYVYIQYKSYLKLQENARMAIQENTSLQQEVVKYEQLKNALNQENDRCEKLLTQEEGNFNDFTYCQKLIEFLSTAAL